MSEILVFPIITLVSYVGVELVRRWSLRRDLFDIPNERSSHTIPTPRGGGLAVVLTSLVAYLIYALATSGKLNWGYFLGAMLVVVISWLDDLYSVSFVWRFCVHVAAAAAAIFSAGYFRELYIPLIQQNVTIEVGGLILTFLWIVWLTNAYNFMDGIDGIAGMQAVTAGLGWLIAGKLSGAEASAFYGGVIAFSGLGFLIQNWQPARIFMGDVGSAFLGYTFAVLPLLVSREIGIAAESRRLPLIAVSLNWLFVFDTIYTFIRRLLNRERVWEAHRGHIYQKFVIQGFSHQAITILYGLISAVTTMTTVLWIMRNPDWEMVWLLAIVVQPLGLLLYLWLIQNRKQ